MQCISTYQSPLGELLLAGDEKGLTGLWFSGDRFYGSNKEKDLPEENELPVFAEARHWLDIYFSGREPDFLPELHISGSPFQIKVWKILRTIPYGETVTYGDIAKKLTPKNGKMSAQAVGGAVGHNKISLIIPCHRVVGAKGNLIGYAGGLDKKIALLCLEGLNMNNFYLPSRHI